MESNDTLRMMRMVDLALGKTKYTYEMRKNQPKPEGKFAAVLLLDEVNPGRDKIEVVELPSGLVHRTSGVRLLTFMIVFTEGVPESAKFISSFMRSDIQDYMVEADLAVLRHKKVSNKTLTLETNWEVREGLLVECITRRRYDTPVNIVEVVEINGEYNEGENVIPMSIKTKEP